jgi:predicted ArsR family transcriptional regulator
MSNWTLFSNHGHVLVCLAGNSEARLRDVAADVGITERAVQKIVRDLQTHGMISVTKHGRRNRYRIHHKKNLRHGLEAHCTLGELMKLVVAASSVGGEVRHDHTGRSEEVPVEPAEAVTTMPEPVQHEPEQAEKAPPEALEVKPVEKRPADTKPAKSIAPDLVERQQGSLF